MPDEKKLKKWAQMANKFRLGKRARKFVFVMRPTWPLTSPHPPLSLAHSHAV